MYEPYDIFASVVSKFMSFRRNCKRDEGGLLSPADWFVPGRFQSS